MHKIIITDFKLKSEYYKGKNIEQQSKKTTITIVYTPYNLKKSENYSGGILIDFYCVKKILGKEEKYFSEE